MLITAQKIEPQPSFLCPGYRRFGTAEDLELQLQQAILHVALHSALSHSICWWLTPTESLHPGEQGPKTERKRNLLFLEQKLLGHLQIRNRKLPPGTVCIHW